MTEGSVFTVIGGQFLMVIYMRRIETESLASIYFQSRRLLNAASLIGNSGLA
jgi:hypothetical protein